MLKAIGKFIDTLPLAHLLSLEEAQSDTVAIEVDRFYDVYDLHNFQFIMRAVTASGAETQTELPQELSADGNYVHLTWNISSLFTTEAGTLFLDLVAYCYDGTGANPETDPPDQIIRYQLPPVEIRDIPKGVSEATDEDSYTAFWTQVRTLLNTHTQQIEALQNRIAVMTQEEYDELENPDPNVIYILTEE
ncbi:MAG: hypothetical protein E7496_00730 [Ruminococcus sp.]|nr:hypothetical protein [Ruminococcus sp.]